MEDIQRTVEELHDILELHATGGQGEDDVYKELRRKLLADPRTQSLVPAFVRKNRNLSQFWDFIKPKFKHWAERREFLKEEFGPLLDSVETFSNPTAEPVAVVLKKLDEDHVATIWSKALSRKEADPEGAITIARSLLESVSKLILDDLEVPYKNNDKLPKLYKKVSDSLQLSPSQHTEDAFKRILGGCTSVVEGLGSLRNKLGDSHGPGKAPVKPAKRHAELAVNLAGSMAQYLVETWRVRREEGEVED